MEIREIGTFLTYFENVRRRTERVIACIPPEQLEWRPRPGSFSFGDLIRHLAATERYMFAENVQGRPSRYPGHGPELASGRADVNAFLQRAHREAVAIFSALSPAELGAACVTPGGARLPVWKWLRAMVEHEVHHRGQLYLMLGLIGVSTPPLYGLTSEQVRARSEPLTLGE
ncbi:MAG: DinB family protein [Longimicrobiales bacterium]